MKVYTFELKIHGDGDEFWEADPSDKEVWKMVAECLSDHGIEVKGNGYEFANDELTLLKMELSK